MFGIEPIWWFAAPAFLAFLVMLTVPLATRRQSVLRLALAALSLLILALAGAGFWSWFYHDWFEPGKHPSQGFEALRRFWKEFRLSFAICVAEMIVLGTICTWRLWTLRSRQARRSGR